MLGASLVNEEKLFAAVSVAEILLVVARDLEMVFVCRCRMGTNFRLSDRLWNFC